MNNRSIRKIIPAQRVNMGGHLLDQPLPTKLVNLIDPFLLIHHWDAPLETGKKQNELGVGPHPHRGFSPVTFIFEGSVRHQDSIGNTVVISEGGTQWMHAGNGIVHSERPGIDLVKNNITQDGDKDLCTYIKNRMRDSRILIGSEGPKDNVLKIRPPLTIDAEGVDMILHYYEKIMKEV